LEGYGETEVVSVLHFVSKGNAEERRDVVFCIYSKEGRYPGVREVLLRKIFKYTQVRFCSKTLSCPLRSCLLSDLLAHDAIYSA
jgi:hypothetical protein